MDRSPRPNCSSEPLLPWQQVEPRPCPYLPGKTATEELSWWPRLDGGDYQMLMDAGFRRSGRTVYRPVCAGCAECVPLRVPVDRFRPSRSQRRVLRRNFDVRCTITLPCPTLEKFRIYMAYQAQQHDGAMSTDYENFGAFLTDSAVPTLEMTYHVAGRVVAVGLVDVTPLCLSSVYCFFDPTEARRSLGVFAALCEIAECQQCRLPYWYAGYYVRECRKMNYKSDYRPCELLGLDNVWRPFAEPPEKTLE